MLSRFFKKTPVPLAESTGLVVTEGVSGYWHYHLSDADCNIRSLCGKQVMHTSIPPERWGVPFGEHFPKRPTWCQECAALGYKFTQRQEFLR